MLIAVLHATCCSHSDGRCHTVSARSLVSLARHLKQESIRLDDNVCLDIGCPANHVVAAFAVEAAWSDFCYSCHRYFLPSGSARYSQLLVVVTWRQPKTLAFLVTLAHCHGWLREQVPRVAAPVKMVSRSLQAALLLYLQMLLLSSQHIHCQQSLTTSAGVYSGQVCTQLQLCHSPCEQRELCPKQSSLHGYAA